MNARAIVVFCGLLSSCGGRAAVPGAGHALSRTVSVIEGEAEARASGAFHKLENEKGVVELRTANGATIALANVGRVSLRAGSRLAIGEDDKGIRLVVEEGAIRYRALDKSNVSVVINGGVVDLTGRDVVVDNGKVVDTATHPDAAAFSFALAAPSAVGVGSMETKTVTGEKGSLALIALNVDGKTAGDLVETSVEHIFHNDSDARLEGAFRFPLPKGAVLTGLAMEIDGKLMEGSLVERDKARKVYEAIVDSMRDPALLEWEHGNTFKLRVFPIEPKSDKRVVLRFLSPVRDGAAGREWVYSARAPGMQGKLDKFSVRLDGKSIVDKKAWTPGEDVVVPMTGYHSAFIETRKDGTFIAVRVTPDWSKVAAPPPPPSRRRVVLFVDTSRSVLEERALTADAVRGVLDGLRPDDRFTLLTGDVDVRDAGGFVAPSAVTIKTALDTIAAIEPDGASDLGAALNAVSKKLATARAEDAADDLELVYVGDGTPTWGVVEPAELAKTAQEKLGSTLFHAVIVGKGGDDAAVRKMVTGRFAEPRTKEEVARFATMIAHARTLKRLREVEIDAGEGAIVHRSLTGNLFEGDALDLYVKLPANAAPKPITLKSGSYLQTIPVDVKPAAHVARLWASQEVSALEAKGADKQAIIDTSLAFGVMSRHTSWLVLESEEAYAQWDIARKNTKTDGDIKVTGADLQSVGSHSSMTPDHLQPGDPELHIPAPSDARSVVAVLPSGETKLAEFEPALGKWTLRFLVDKDVPDGTYEIHVRIVHAGGEVELQKIAYHVDTKAPTFAVSIVRVADGYEIKAVQVITDEEVKSGLPAAEVAGANLSMLKEKYAHILTDSKRLEVATPDGKTIALDGVKLGTFRGVWKTPPVTSEVKLHFVGADRALNERSFDVTVLP
jgi:hypothetical protein